MTFGIQETTFDGQEIDFYYAAMTKILTEMKFVG